MSIPCTRRRIAALSLSVMAVTGVGLAAPVATAAPLPAVTMSAQATGATLTAGSQLTAGQSITSPSGLVTLIMQTDGNLVVYGAGGVLWHAGTTGNAGARFVLQQDGNAVVYAANNTALWSSGTATKGGQSLTIQDDGNLVLRNGTGATVWATYQAFARLMAGRSLVAGQYLTSPDFTQRLVIQGDGNLVVYKGGVAGWSSGSGRSTQDPATKLVMQTDGNAVIYRGSTALWWTKTAGTNNTLRLQNGGVVEVVNSSGAVVWSSTGVAPARQRALTRAAHWLTAWNGGPVPYSQSAYFEGYRRDCSGFVSMALELWKPGPNTVGLTDSSLTRRITLGELKPGDLLIDAIGTNTTRHVVMFEKWTDSSHTRYWAYEQRGSYGTTHRTLTYGLNSGSEYKPYRPVKFGD